MEFDTLADQIQNEKSVYIRYVDNAFVAEKKSFWTDIKNYLSAARKEQYDFEKNFAKIAEQFPKIAKDEAQFDKLNGLADKLNALLDHVNASRIKKNKPPYRLEKITIKHPVTLHPLQDVFPMAQLQ